MILHAVARVVPRANVGSVNTLSEATIDLVKQRLAESAVGSWENGTRAQALLEYDWPKLAVFYNPAVPIVAGHVPAECNAIAEYTIANRPAGTMMFCEDGSAADPASLGISVLIANHTMDVDYMSAVEDENEWLFTYAPRTADGAISHRVSEVQLWSDFVAMVPPYLAYYGALHGNDTFTQAAYDQCRLYRNYLNNGTGLWQHIVLGNYIARDYGFWTTGNAWAAYGMLRVLVTMMHSEYREVMESQKDDLKAWIVEILQASYAHTNTTTGLLPNYLGEDTFSEASATALMVAVSYRLGQLGLDSSTIPNAHAARKAVFAAVDPNTGWLTSVVNPRDWSSAGEESAEGQSFTLLLAAAYRDYVATTNDLGDDIPIATGTPSVPAPTGTTSTTGKAFRAGLVSTSATSIALLLSLILPIL